MYIVLKTTMSSSLRKKKTQQMFPNSKLETFIAKLNDGAGCFLCYLNNTVLT